jgi:hypothetical protein
MTKLKRESPSPVGLPLPSDIVVPESPSEPQPLEWPYPDENYNDVNEYDDLIVH